MNALCVFGGYDVASTCVHPAVACDSVDVVRVVVVRFVM